ncbi:MAG TPA: ribulose-phosphate 3-epimerase [Firmicutes bacterium]|nr:ribulose-phosphate 3-epimerase [Bacillota bacterium]HAW71710.1 ribulose-phosphate 3-epimerase [Bacillota bacterium]HAZ21201.1 ribulose-phosphate 3-epimerase [Bacillota bacterium]HBG43250.1 ribulose-phosphate 3-epimerase [Bacillota bacterium]HBL50495.1 ribulose-phosphate 3-epimerase [Bacillota bacterium]
MMRLAPSLLTADFLNLGTAINAIAEADEIHLDIMDGHYVPNLSFGPVVAQAVRQATRLNLSAHLMVTNPDEMVPWFVAAGCGLIVVHAEASTHLHRSLQNIKNLGADAGVALNPSTPLGVLEYIAHDLKRVLLMSVNPGFGGQLFIPAIYDKIKKLVKLRHEWNCDFEIEVDGGVKADNIERLAQAGVDIAVVGSAVFGPGDPGERLRHLRQALGSQAHSERRK